MTDRLDAAVDGYLQASILNVAPPPVPSDPLVGGGTPVEQLLRVLGLVANSGDLEDGTDSADRHAQRDLWTTEAADAFAGQDSSASGQFGDLAQQQSAAQQLPQLASGIAGAVTGVLTGLVQPWIGLPQQLAQATTSLVGASGPLDRPANEDPGPDVAGETDSVPIGFDDIADPAAADGVGTATDTVIGPTSPAAALSPPPVASSATYPSAAAAAPPTRVTAVPTAASAPATMTGMPMVPPTAVPAGDSKTETKRVAVAPVRNGAPVRGRLTTATAGPTLTTRVDGRPVATRQIRDSLIEDPG